jgi:hypothetical protein
VTCTEMDHEGDYCKFCGDWRYLVHEGQALIDGKIWTLVPNPRAVKCVTHDSGLTGWGWNPELEGYCGKSMKGDPPCEWIGDYSLGVRLG